MIESIYNAFWPQLIMQGIIYTLVLAMIFLDLWSGVRKARQRKECRSSYGYKKTVEKIARYYNALFVITVIDAVQMLGVWQLGQQTGRTLPVIPVLTLAGAIFVGFIELKSIYEKSEDKEKAKIADAAALLGKALKDHDTREIISAVAEYMNDTRQGHRRGPSAPRDERKLHFDDPEEGR